MSTVLERAKALRDSAKFSRDFEDYPGAIKDLETAQELLLNEYEEWQKQQQQRGDSQGTKDEEYEHKLLTYLADCYGMLGGIYRRQGLKAKTKEERLSQLEESKKMYLKGLEYERDDSYNLVNTIVIPLLIDPASYNNQREEIKTILRKVDEQVRGKRKEQWWAWADLGLLYLLDGNLADAINAYAQFKRTGARPEDYDSTSAVLKELKESLNGLSGTVVENLEQAIEYLNKNKP